MATRKRKAAAKTKRRAPNKKYAYLAAYMATCDLTASAIAVGINRAQHYEWLRTDPKYAEAFAAAKVEAIQTLHDAAVNRALVGVYEPLVYQGQFSYPMEEYEISPAEPEQPELPELDWKDEGGPRAYQPFKPAKPAVKGMRPIAGAPPLGVYKRSEMLHAQLLRAHIPAFRTNYVEVAGPGGGPIPLEQQRLAVLNDEELSGLIALARKLTAARADGSGTAQTPPK